MIDPRTAPYGLLHLRAAMGILWLAHAARKLVVFTPAGAAQFFAPRGLPGARACVTLLREVAGGLALIPGFRARIVSAARVPILLGAIVTRPGPAGFFFSHPNGGWESFTFWITGLGMVALAGEGAHALRRTSGPVPDAALI